MTTEEIVKAAYDAGFSSSEIHKKLPEFKRLIEFAAAAEREACAQICDYYASADHANYSDICAEAIRAMGNHARG